MRQYDAALVRVAARLLFRGAPNKMLAEALGCPRGTARSWISAHRRPPIKTLQVVRKLLNEHANAALSLAGDFDRAIARREGEPPVRKGFMVVKERDGRGSLPRDGRPRWGTNWLLAYVRDERGEAP